MQGDSLFEALLAYHVDLDFCHYRTVQYPEEIALELLGYKANSRILSVSMVPAILQTLTSG